MVDKQDRSTVRTAAQLEQKHQFGKTFAEMIGLINDSRDKVDSVESSLRDEIISQSTTLQRNTEEIVAKAEKTLREDLDKIAKDAELKLDADGVKIIVSQEISNGVDRVVTKAGYSFDDDGLNISKNNSGITNKLDNTGVYVSQSGEEILTANDKGVDAVNLHAKTYLIIGAGDGRSRFEDYGTNRTGCFWLGG